MRRVINSTYMSVDGVVQEPQHWTFDYRSEDAGQYARDLLFSCDTVIMGRRTYESFAQVWPNLTDETGMADRMNSLPKFVASDTLTDPAWNNTTVIKVKDFPELVRDLKTRPGQNIVQYGVGPLTTTLIGEGLLDELRLWLHPISYGKAGPGRPHLPPRVRGQAPPRGRPPLRLGRGHPGLPPELTSRPRSGIVV